MAVTCGAEIAILMAVYNGGQFVGEQLESLRRQTFSDFELFVHDDGSSDDTLEIIRNFASRSGMKITILTDSRNRGPKGSFLWLLENVEARYYMFCDQDDVWLPEKIGRSYDKLRELEQQRPGVPAMVHTDLRVVDADLNTINPSFWSYAGYTPDLQRKFGYAATNNVFTGCTMIINRAARDASLPAHPDAPMHDWWIGLVCAKYGLVDNLKSQTVLYRQHGRNAASAGESGDMHFSAAKALGLMDKYKQNREMLTSLGFTYPKALYFKILYTLHRICRR